MDTLLDISLFLLIAWLCWRGYNGRQSWLRMIPYLIWQQCQGRGMIRQLLVFAPVVVGWLLLCHWLNAHGWHATGAGGMLFAMTLGLDAMRSAEERQKMGNQQ
ncbi:hypothetical protein FE236_09175 [Mariprofundus erugo]|uniref:Uncharacterized protein n=1 Tax=Mariprofundus erugo TaxID=2528639 RepID=A0A5R9GQ62_9PROT|nr:hypothetical protein [Mariprofundus erugo]TLS66132.1 hypothetical protein FEF65_11085 [Mariprofundus erugo]TLS75611.1 hypothetical protein FE236_09175 [Mariprofundus erugo]